MPEDVSSTLPSAPSVNAPVTLPAGSDNYVTIFRPYTGTESITAPVTVSTISPADSKPGTVIVETPEPVTQASPTTSLSADIYITIYRPYTGANPITAPITLTTMPAISGTGAVIIETPVPQTASVIYATIYRPYTGTARITEPITVTTIAPMSGGEGTVIIETPTPEPTTDSQASDSPAITIPSNDENRNVTVIRPYPGPKIITAPITSYIPLPHQVNPALLSLRLLEICLQRDPSPKIKRHLPLLRFLQVTEAPISLLFASIQAQASSMLPLPHTSHQLHPGNLAQSSLRLPLLSLKPRRIWLVLERTLPSILWRHQA
ncbi:hypothetical protein NXS19_004548 [Fusarium pseudograminearum]|nr:hypothetical protein NXS19_004548 [Fusarium pseudograminearum]